LPHLPLTCSLPPPAVAVARAPRVGARVCRRRPEGERGQSSERFVPSSPARVDRLPSAEL